MRKWSVSLYILDENGEPRPADCFQRVTYNLHPSFENPVQSMLCLPVRGKSDQYNGMPRQRCDA